MDKFGLVLISYPYSEERASTTRRSIASLAKTNTKDVNVILQITYHESPFMAFDEYLSILSSFDVRRVDDSTLGTSGQGNLSTASATHLLATDKDVTHVIFMYDDFVYNPEWLQELVLLKDRHTVAKAWSVYRSSYVKHHKIIFDDCTDVKMTMHDGVGCVEREEWEEYSKMLVGDFATPDFQVEGIGVGGGNTFDIHHAAARPGERWATGRDYWENIGVHKHLGRQDMAIDFVGEQ